MVLGKIFGGDTIKTISNVVDDLHFSGEEKEKLKSVHGRIFQNVLSKLLHFFKILQNTEQI